MARKKPVSKETMDQVREAVKADPSKDSLLRIADTFGVRIPLVYRVRLSLGLTKSKDETYRQMKEIRKAIKADPSSENLEKLARETGRSYMSLITIRRELGLSTERGANWTRNQESAVKEAYLDGERIEDIAAKHNRSISAIYLKLNELGVKRERRNRLTPSVVERICKIIKAGGNNRQAARICKVSDTTVRKILKDKGIASRFEEVGRKMAQETKLKKVEQQGWPKGCTVHKARLLKGLESIGFGTVKQICDSSGYSNAEPRHYSLLRQMKDEGWIILTQVKMGTKNKVHMYALSEAVKASREAAVLQNEKNTEEPIPEVLQPYTEDNFKLTGMSDVIENRAGTDGNPGMRIIKGKNQ